VMLQVRAQHRRRALDRGDGLELVEDHQQRGAVRHRHQQLDELVVQRAGVGTLGGRQRELGLQPGQVDAGLHRQLHRRLADLRHRLPHRGGQPHHHIGVGLHPEQVHRDGRHLGQVGREPAQHRGLAEPARPEQGGDPVLGDAVGQVGQQAVSAPDLLRLERPLIRERRHLHVLPLSR